MNKLIKGIAALSVVGLGGFFGANALFGDDSKHKVFDPFHCGYSQECWGKDSNMWNDPKLYDFPQHQAYMKRVGDALGTFKDVEIWAERTNPDDEWQLVNGTYIPVTQDGKTPAEYKSHMRSDRPMMLPTNVQGFDKADGQSNPWSVVGRPQGSNPETQWVFLVRKYFNKEKTDPTFTMAGDVAVIGHHPRTGATTYFQFYHPQEPKEARVVISPFSGEKGMRFWSPLVTNAEYFQCQRCHNADPFLHSPWIDQARVSEPKPNQPFPEPMVPSNPLGAFHFIDTEDGMFEIWDEFLVHMENKENTCTECHRVSPYDGAGLYENSTRFVGVDPKKRNEYGWLMHEKYQTKEFQPLPWMPPSDLGDFYAGQKDTLSIWEDVYKTDAEFVNQASSIGIAKVADVYAEPAFTPAQKATFRKVPTPPEDQRSIMIDRPLEDQFVANSGGVMVLDTRMKANTDGTLARWQFISTGADVTARAAPAVFELAPGNGSKIQYRLVYLGAARATTDGGTWQDLTDGETFALKQGQFLGLYLFSTDTNAITTKGMVPYSADDYLKVTARDGSTLYPDGVVTHRANLSKAPSVGDVVTFSDSNYATYSFEMQNDI